MIYDFLCFLSFLVCDFVTFLAFFSCFFGLPLLLGVLVLVVIFVTGRSDFDSFLPDVNFDSLTGVDSFEKLGVSDRSLTILGGLIGSMWI